MENQSLDAYKLTKIRPTVAGLADCKDTRYDCSMMLGICNPFAMEVGNFQEYNILKLRDNQRFFEVMLSRYGTANSIVGLYFDGAVSYFAELPSPKDLDALERVYRWIKSIEKPKPQKSQVFITWSKIINKLRGKDKEI